MKQAPWWLLALAGLGLGETAALIAVIIWLLV